MGRNTQNAVDNETEITFSTNIFDYRVVITISNIKAEKNEQKPVKLQTLRSHFESFSDSEQYIVQIISMVHSTMMRAMLLKSLVKLDITTSAGKRYTSQTLDLVFNQFRAKALIDEGDYIKGSDYFSNYALALAAQSGRLEEIAEVLERIEKEGHSLVNKNETEKAIKIRRIRLAFFRKDYDSFG